MKLSTKMALKVVNSIFTLIPDAKEYEQGRWYRSIVRWLIDSKYRKFKRVNDYLSDQIKNSPQQLIEVSSNFTEKYDERIINILNYVVENYDYLTDKEKYGKLEFWSSVRDTFRTKTGDCENINSLIYIIGRLSGIPSYLMWNVTCDVYIGGHYMMLYYSPKRDKVYKIDATYYPDTTSISKRKPFSYSKDKVKDIWYVFNEVFTLKNA